MNVEQVDNPTLKEVVQKDSPLKDWLVDYVGQQKKPKNGDVTVEMIVEVIAKEFPEFLMVVAEENFIRGYEQAIFDVESEPKFVKSKKVITKKK